jgi:replication initiation protein RepC
MTFLPGRLIQPTHGSAIVFPSNKTLCARLNGMPDSTLRRHLAALVANGIVSRHDSANRKRFARSKGQGARIAFGLDLSPLARRHAEITDCANRATQRQEHLQAMRANVAQLRQQVLLQDGETALTEDAFKALRRQPDLATLHDMETALNAKLVEIEALKMNATDDQNERHIEDEIIYYSVSQKEAQKMQSANAVPHQNPNRVKLGLVENSVPLESVLKRLKAYSEFYPEPVRHWNDLISIADRLTHMMGIDGSVFKESIAVMGAKQAAVVVLAILEKFAQIENPGGYLRRLNQSARDGRFSVKSLMPNNKTHDYCQLTI